MVDNVKVGEFYKFHLTGDKGGEVLKGRVIYKDDKVISLWNDDFGEAEFPIDYCTCVEPLIMIDKEVLENDLIKNGEVYDSMIKRAIGEVVTKYGKELESIEFIQDEIIIKLKGKSIDE